MLSRFDLPVQYYRISMLLILGSDPLCLVHMLDLVKYIPISEHLIYP